MKWTLPADIRIQIERLWASGDLCRAAVDQQELFPLCIPLRQPSAKFMLETFGDVMDWDKKITVFSEQYGFTLKRRQVNHRALGKQQMPSYLVLDQVNQAVSLIGKKQQLKQFIKLYHLTEKRLARLLPWLMKQPIKVLELTDEWGKLLDLCAWMQMHPNPNIYMRQVDVVGIDSKFIEQHRSILASLFDMILPVYSINDDFSGVAGFARRYGFLDKPVMLRVRSLDSRLALLHTAGCQDVVMTAKAFASLQPSICAQIKLVFIVENEVNYLAFPDVRDALLLFGSGYGFDALKSASWLNHCMLYYWGDMDTHGFAILNQLRTSFPHVQSMLMDRATLMAYQHAWSREPKQEKGVLRHLHEEETRLYDDLRFNVLGEQVRMEQERVAFDDVERTVKALVDASETIKS